MMNIFCKKIVGGKAEGLALLSNKPLNMLSMLDTKSGEIKDKEHDLFNRTLANRILIFPNCIGSSVGAYVFYSLKINDVNPKAIICTNKCDIITASGCAISDIPLVDGTGVSFKSLNKNTKVTVDADNQMVILGTL
jgi:predicted aconitase with swiveling domain